MDIYKKGIHNNELRKLLLLHEPALTTIEDLKQWSKRSLKQQVKKIEENLNLIQQGKEEDAEIFIGNNTRQRNGLNMVSEMLEGHLQKIANITLERTPSQAMELLETELITTKKTPDKGDREKETE